MTHVMVPDGTLPWWLSVTGWVLAGALLSFALWRLRDQPAPRMVPLTAVVTALMVVVMSFELLPIGYELHFTTLAGMLVGPWYGAIAALLLNVLRALLGDGAFTNVGLNTTITWLEIALGSALWVLARPLARRSAGVAAGLVTFVSLLLATVAFVCVVALSTVDPRELVETGTYDGGAGGFGAFALAVLALGTVGALIEALIVGAVVAFIARVRPALLGLTSPAAWPTAPSPGQAPAGKSTAGSG